MFFLLYRFIVDKGGDLTATDKHGWSVLQYAVRYAPSETVEALLDMGCDMFHKERKGWNCLHLAARNGQPEKARLLLEKGARVNDDQDQGKLNIDPPSPAKLVVIILTYGVRPSVNLENRITLHLHGLTWWLTIR